MSKPKYIWINGVNLNGLWFSEPKRARYDKSLDDWYYRGNFNAQPGITEKDYCITFGSENKDDAQAFTAGALAMSKLLSRTYAYWGSKK